MAKSALGFMQLTIIIGFSMFYAWYLIAFFGLFIFPPFDIGFTQLHLEQIMFFVGSIVSASALIAVFNKTDSVAIGHARLLYLACLIPGLLMPAATIAYNLGLELPIAVFCIASFLTGAAAAIGFMLWEDLSTHGCFKRGVLSHGIIFCAGGIIFLAAVPLLSNLEICIASCLLLAGSTALLAFIAPRCDAIEDKPAKPAREHFRKVWHVEIVILVLNAMFGYAFMMLYYIDTTLLLIAMGIAIFIDLVFSIMFGRGKWLQFAGAMRICGAFASVALLVVACATGTIQVAAISTIILFWFLFRTMDGGSLTDLANRNDLSALYCSTRGKMPANIGFAIGLSIGLGAIVLGPASAAFPYVALGLVAAFIIAVLFFMPSNGDTFDAGYKTLSLVRIHESPDSGLKRQCELMTAQFGLSPRESDVLEYLVRGRNAKHIAEKLFISESTVKTHISNIYRKAGVHSQQELLDKLEPNQRGQSPLVRF